MSVLLNVDGLRLTFAGAQDPSPALVVNDISFELKKGDVLGLVGESGSGKSLTAKAIMGVLPLGCRNVGGSISFDGQDLLTLSEDELCQLRGNRVAMLFQDPLNSFNPLHRIGRQIGEGVAIHKKWSREKIDQRVEYLLDRVGMGDSRRIMKSFPHQLSGGQRQRAMLAMMIANEPDILIADEPTTALDAVIQEQVLDLLSELRGEFGLTILMISHDLAMVRRIADRLCVMQNGQIIEQGDARRIIESPEHPYTRMLLRQDDGAVSSPVPEDVETVLEVNDLNVFYRSGEPLLPWQKPPQLHAVRNVSLTLRKGECLGIVGESGSGKSSLGLAILKLIRSQGQICFRGTDLDKIDERQMQKLRREIQIVFQDPLAALNPRLSVHQCIAEGLEAQQGLDACEIERRVIEALNEVELDESMRHRYPHEFSGGQCQRICLARALVMKPSCIIFDEPTSSLDRNTQFQVIALLRRLQQQLGLASLFITHDLTLVRSLCSKVMIMQQGQVVEHGDCETVYRQPRHEYTQKLLAAAHIC